MSKKDNKEVIEMLRGEGFHDEWIINNTLINYYEGNVTKQDVIETASILGYELTEAFKNDNRPTPYEIIVKSKGKNIDKAEKQEIINRLKEVGYDNDNIMGFLSGCYEQEEITGQDIDEFCEMLGLEQL